MSGIGRCNHSVALRSQKVRVRVRVGATVCESAEESGIFPSEGLLDTQRQAREGARSDIRASLKA